MTAGLFLVLTFAISLSGFAMVVLVPGAGSPHSLKGLPFWVLMVWGPSLAAIILAASHGQVGDLLARAIDYASVPWEAWCLTLAPLALLLLLRPFAPDESSALGPGMVLAMIALNLVLGPLGEELGWRGVLQDELAGRMGWLEASLIVGVVWFIWHLPLWTIDSPHAQIPLHLFAFHCMAYAIIIGAAHTLSQGSILPAILIHLTVNLASNLAVFAGFRAAESWFSTSLLPYWFLAVLAVVLTYARTGRLGLDWLASRVV